MKIKSEEFSWRTRGHDWDYDFIKEYIPEYTKEKGITLYKLHTILFKDVTPTETPQNSIAKYLNFKAIGTCFIDENKDEFDRPIRHYFIIYSQSSEIESQLPNDWGKRLLKNLNYNTKIKKENLSSNMTESITIENGDELKIHQTQDFSKQEILESKSNNNKKKLVNLATPIIALSIIFAMILLI